MKSIRTKSKIIRINIAGKFPYWTLERTLHEESSGKLDQDKTLEHIQKMLSEGYINRDWSFNRFAVYYQIKAYEFTL